jgi:hypothetical protein
MRMVDRYHLRALLPWLAGIGIPVLLVTLVWYWLRPRSSPLELIVYDAAGRFGNQADLSPLPNDPENGGRPRLPLLLAVRNTGTRSASTGAMVLYLPSWLHLERDDGTPYDAETEGGNPLLRYRIAFGPVRVEARRFPVVVPGRERIWLRPFASPYHCALDDEGRPIFLSAPSLDPALLADATIFWVVEETGSARRSTGTLELQMDPSLFDVEPALMPPEFPASVLPPDVARPDLASLPVEGRRTSSCGLMIEPLTLQSTVYQAGEAGRIIALTVADTVKRLLFDMDGDKIVEAEAWDRAGTGRLDTVRRARYAIPEFLLPPPPPPPPPPITPDSVPADTLQAAPPDTTARSP